MGKDIRYINGILLLYKYPPGPNNLIDHVNAFEDYSRFKVWKVNTLAGFPKYLANYRFSIIVMHYSFMYTINYSNPVTEQFAQYVDSCADSYKIAFFQDEHHTCQRRFSFLNAHHIDCIYTLLEEEAIKDVYGKYTGVKKIISTLPSYVNDELARAASEHCVGRERPIDIGYRGRELPEYMGKGALEKSEIAVKFKAFARDTGLALDIEMGEKFRVYGEKWYRFISNCKAMLGVEAGVSIFDIEDEIRAGYDRRMSIKDRNEREKAAAEFLNSREDRIYYRTVSPRQFELAAFKTVQILYEGRYSGVVKPLVHYIPLKKDFSNFDDVIRMFRDESFRKELTDNAYRDIILSGEYSYRKFIEAFDRNLEKEGLSSGVDKQQAEKVSKDFRRGRFTGKIKSAVKKPFYSYFPGRDFLKSVAIRFFELTKSKRRD